MHTLGRSQTGFTLIELMITIVVLAIIVGIAVPSLTALINNNRQVAATNDLVSDLATARAEAVARGRRVTVCPSSDGVNCSTDWTQSRLVFVEMAGSSAIEGKLDTDDITIRKSAAAPNTAWTIVGGSGSGKRFTYTANGAVLGSGSIAIVSNGDSSTRRLICINVVGSSTLKKGASVTC